MTANDFRRLALGMDGVIESAHMHHPDFRVGNRIFATLTHDEDAGMVSLPPGEVQQEFIRAHPSAFSMVNGAWGLQGATRVHLEQADEDAVGEAMTVAHRYAVMKGPTRRTKSTKKTKAAKKANAVQKEATPARATRTVKELLAPYPRDVQSLAKATREVMLDGLPDAKESADATGPYIHYSYAPGYKGVVGYITVNQTGVKLGLVGGARLADPKKLLRGTGKSGRHFVVKTPDDLSTPGLRQLIRAALAAWKKERA